MKVFEAGDFKQAAVMISEKASSREGTGDELMWRLEEGSICFDASEYKKSLKAFDQAEKLIKNFDDRADYNVRRGSAEVGSAMTNTNALPYKGFYYDRIMLNSIKALDYLALGNPEGARVEIRRMHERQKEAEKNFEKEIESAKEEIEKNSEENREKIKKEKIRSNSSGQVDFDGLLKNQQIKKSYEKSISNTVYGNCANPFATYLSAISYLSENNFNDALVDFRNLHTMEADNELIKKYLVTCARSIGSKTPPELENVKPFDFPLNNNIVYVIFANGMGPALKQVKVDLILPFVGYTGFAYPEMEFMPSAFKHIIITDSKGTRFHTKKIASMDSVFSWEFHELMPIIITRIAISTISKEVASFIATRAAKRAGGVGAEIGAYIVTGIYKYAFNTADTRCWQTLSKEYQVSQFPMPKDRKLTVTAGDLRRDLILKNAKMAIIYVKSPTSNVLSVKVFYINN